MKRFSNAIDSILEALRMDGDNKKKMNLINNDRFRNHYLFIVYDSRWSTGRLAELDFMIRFTLKDETWEALMQASAELKSRLKRMGRLTYHEI